MGQVSAAEQRAVRLLGELVDKPRLGAYLATGYLPARGNITGKTYLVGRPVIEELNGREVVARWCVHIETARHGRLEPISAMALAARRRMQNAASCARPSSRVFFSRRYERMVGLEPPDQCQRLAPMTDNVMVVRALIEGNESEFLRIGKGHRTAIKSRGVTRAVVYGDKTLRNDVCCGHTPWESASGEVDVSWPCRERGTLPNEALMLRAAVNTFYGRPVPLGVSVGEAPRIKLILASWRRRR